MPLFFEKFTWFLLLTTLFLAGCTNRDPNPELSDPIYLDLKVRVGDFEGAVASSQSAIAEETANRDKAEVRSKDLALAKKRLREAEIKLDRAQQQLRYYQIKLERRKLEARISYETALREGKTWPDPAEFRAYEANKQLRSSNLQWSSRVPKLQERIDSFSKKKPAAPSGASH